MKNKFTLVLLCLTALFTGCSKENVDDFTSDKSTTSFNVSVESGVQTRATVTNLTRYIMEIYKGTTATGTPEVHKEQATGTFTDVVLENAQAYTLLFWADYGTPSTDGTHPAANEYNASDLKAAKVALQPTQAAFSGVSRFTVGTDDETVYTAVTLKHAVAQVNFKQTEALTSTSNTLVVTYPKSYSLNVDDNSTTELTGTVAHTFTYNSKAIGTLGTDYIIAATGTPKTLMDISAVLNGETAKEVTNVPFERNYKTNISGAYSDKYDATMTVACNDEWEATNNEESFGSTTTNSFEFTIKTDATGATNTTQMTLPFTGPVPTGVTLSIDWGSTSVTEAKVGTTAVGTTTGGVTTLAGGTDITNITANYGTAGTYTLQIASSATATEEQMPKFTFANAGDKEKLITVNSALLNFTQVTTTNLERVFTGCSNLTSVPSNLLVNNTAATTFSLCFANCRNLTSLPDGLFDKNIATTNFEGCFYGCTSLTSLPDGLFDKNIAATNFSGCFKGCISLTSLPDGLFDKNVAADSFPESFTHCTSLTSLPDGLFDNNIAATNFSGCFRGCTALSAIPSGLFDHNTEVTDFSSCFYSCTALNTIPSGLFAKNMKVIEFSQCFRYTYSLVLNADIFIDATNTKATRFASLSSVNFSACFMEAGASLTNGTSTAPDLWSYTYASRPLSNDCFTDSKISNKTSVPSSGWGTAIQL